MRERERESASLNTLDFQVQARTDGSDKSRMETHICGIACIDLSPPHLHFLIPGQNLFSYCVSLS